MEIQATFTFYPDTSELDPEFVDIKGLAEDLAKKELEYLIAHQLLSAEDFTYSVTNDNDTHAI